MGTKKHSQPDKISEIKKKFVHPAKDFLHVVINKHIRKLPECNMNY